MRKPLILIFLTLYIHTHSQIDSYFKKTNSPGSIIDIVKLLNLKNAKKITVFSKDFGKNEKIGEIFINKNGKFTEKRSFHGNNMYHKYDDNGKLIASTFSHIDSTEFSHIEYIYDKKEKLIEIIHKNKFGKITDNITDTLDIAIRLAISNSYDKIPLYYNNSDSYTYNSEGYLIRYFDKGFYRPSSFSKEDEKGYQNNEIEYTYVYNQQFQIIKFYKRLQTTCTFGELTITFNYINDTTIESFSNTNGKPLDGIGLQKLVYKIDYY